MPCCNRRLTGLGAASTQPQGGASPDVLELPDSTLAAIGVVDVLAQDFIHAHAVGNRPAASAALRLFQTHYNAHLGELAMANNFLVRGALPGPLLVDGIWGTASRFAVMHTAMIQAALDTSQVAAYAWANQLPAVGASGAAYASWLAARPVSVDFGPPPAVAPSAPAVSPDSSGSSAQGTRLPVVNILASRTTPGAQWPWYVGLSAVGLFGLWLAYNRFRR